MIEAMEQKIINSIRSKYLKNESLRKDIDYDSISNSLRIICSSRSSFFNLFKSLEENTTDTVLLNELLKKVNDVYDWITYDCISEIILSYENPDTKDMKRKLKYIEQAPYVKSGFVEIKQIICSQTLEKLLEFNNLK